MRFNLFITLVALTLSSACQRAANTTLETKASPTTSVYQKAPDQADGVPRITAEEAKKEYDAGNAVFVDTRAEYAYRMEHIKGAINIPMEAIEARYRDIPEGKKIIAYCD